MATSWGSMDFEVLGATVLQPRPLYRTFVPLEPGLSVLYGKNGAGKSRLLEALEASVKGQQGRSWVWLHVRLRERMHGLEPTLTMDLLRMLGGGRELFSGNEDLAPELELRGRIILALREIWDGEFDDSEALATEIGLAGHLALLPTGGESEHLWRVYVAALPDDTTPLLTARATEFRRSWEAALAHEDESDREAALFELVSDEPLHEGLDFSQDDPVPYSQPGRPELIFELGTLRRTQPLSDLYVRPTGDLEGATIQRLLRRDGRRRQVLIPGTAELSDDLLEDIAYLSARATDLLSLILEDSPNLQCSLAAPEDWVDSQPLTWRASFVGGPLNLPLSDLSEAQRRWAELAIAAVLVELTTTGARAVMLLDEPETALHSRAIRNMALGLEQLVRVIGVDIIAATHASALIESPEARLLHAQRDAQGFTAISVRKGVDESDASLLGLTPADLLQLTRLFVIVEGVHDQILLEQVCSDELLEARARVLAMRGVPNAPKIVEAEFLLRFSDADFLVVMDALDPQMLEDTWAQVRELFERTRDLDLIRDELQARLPGAAGAENRFVRELILSALALRQDHRLHFQTLPARDVILYLPVASFTEQRTTWDKLQGEYDKQTTKMAFKKWLTQSKSFCFDDAAIRQAAQSLDQLHPDLTRLAATIRRWGPAG